MTKCTCVNVKAGSYDNQILMINNSGKTLSIDKCMKADRQREAIFRNNPFDWKNGFDPTTWWWTYLGEKQVEKPEGKG